MKKILLLLVSLMTLFSPGGKADPGDAILIEISKETDPEEIPRSATSDIDCCYLISSELLVVQFNVNLGSAEVSVIDQTNTLVGYEELSTTPGLLYVPVNAGTGTYDVSIETSSGNSYSGQFILY